MKPTKQDPAKRKAKQSQRPRNRCRARPDARNESSRFDDDRRVERASESGPTRRQAQGSSTRSRAQRRFNPYHERQPRIPCLRSLLSPEPTELPSDTEPGWQARLKPVRAPAVLRSRPSAGPSREPYQDCTQEAPQGSFQQAHNSAPSLSPRSSPLPTPSKPPRKRAIPKSPPSDRPSPQPYVDYIPETPPQSSFEQAHNPAPSDLHSSSSSPSPSPVPLPSRLPPLSTPARKPVISNSPPSAGLSRQTCLGYNPEPSPQGSFDHTHAPTPLHSPSPSPEPLLSLSPSPSPSPSPEPLLSLSPSPSSSTCPSLSLSPSPEPSPPLPEPARSPAASKSPPPAEPSRAPSLEFIPETPPDSFEHTDAPAPEPEPSHPPESKLESETESEPEPEPMPDLLNKAHDEVAVLADYTKRWEKIERMVRPGHHEVEAFLSFAAIPWPMLHTPSGPSDITRQSVREFVILSRTRDQTARAWRRAFLLRWHPDKFKRWMSFVVPVDRASVIAAVTAIATIANELMSDESI
ncbi:hypothetical protein RSOLAG1IB_11310 [Rhizoctonia solani AG-1 IB]|uniref:Uncharacterized protein n=1 Tax=Thanatephorus cucumeris (strain AG1-IB / isolate 7/3/14) TaxID=1108050 RepID=A0A0B7FAE9_THACB|nr:hypothetical protein RSOLAG1IB_11310 [Rhizoctonia solani AG-1 IB]